jgi:hypothetical protein
VGALRVRAARRARGRERRRPRLELPHELAVDGGERRRLAELLGGGGCDAGLRSLRGHGRDRAPSSLRSDSRLRPERGSSPRSPGASRGASGPSSSACRPARSPLPSCPRRLRRSCGGSRAPTT